VTESDRTVAWCCSKCLGEVVCERPQRATTHNRKAIAMHLPIDTSTIRFTCTRIPELRTIRETGQPRVDRDSGKELWQVQVMALTDPAAIALAANRFRRWQPDPRHR